MQNAGEQIKHLQGWKLLSENEQDKSIKARKHQSIFAQIGFRPEKSWVENTRKRESAIQFIAELIVDY